MTSGNEGKVHGVKDGKVESNAQHNKKENLNKGNIWVTMWTKVSAWMQQQYWRYFSCESDQWMCICWPPTQTFLGVRHAWGRNTWRTPKNVFVGGYASADSLGTGMYIMVYILYDTSLGK